MVYLSPSQVTRVFSSQGNFDVLLNSIFEGNCPCSSSVDDSASTSIDTTKQTRSIISNDKTNMETEYPDERKELTDTDFIRTILERNGPFPETTRPMHGIEKIKRHVDKRYRNRLNVYNPSLTSKMKTQFLSKNRTILDVTEDEDEYEPSATCQELKRKRKAELELKRKHLYRDFVKCKKYKDDPSRLVVLYSKY